MSNTVCNHDWTEYYDADLDAACYNDGLNYRPAEYICTKCRKTRKIKYDDEMKWYENLLLFPFLVVVILYLVTIAPVIMLIGFITDHSRKS